MEIQAKDHRIWYDPLTQTVFCQGSFRLAGMDEYMPIARFLEEVLQQQPPLLTLNLQALNFLNSSGINVLSKFVIKVRQLGTVKLAVQGSNDIPWQSKSLKNLQRLMPDLHLEFQ